MSSLQKVELVLCLGRNAVFMSVSLGQQKKNPDPKKEYRNFRKDPSRWTQNIILRVSLIPLLVGSHLLTSLLIVLTLGVFILLFGPCIFNLLVKFVPSRLQLFHVKMMFMQAEDTIQQILPLGPESGIQRFSLPRQAGSMFLGSYEAAPEDGPLPLNFP